MLGPAYYLLPTTYYFQFNTYHFLPTIFYPQLTNRFFLVNGSWLMDPGSHGLGSGPALKVNG